MNTSDFRAIKKVVNSTVYGTKGRGDLHKEYGGGNSDSANQAIAAQIISGNSTDGFAINLYENGVDQGVTGTAINVFAIDMASEDSACVGEYVVVFRNTFTYTAIEEEE